MATRRNIGSSDFKTFSGVHLRWAHKLKVYFSGVALQSALVSTMVLRQSYLDGEAPASDQAQECAGGTNAKSSRGRKDQCEEKNRHLSDCRDRRLCRWI